MLMIARAKRLVVLSAGISLIGALLVLAPGMASAQPVVCGEVITEDTTLQNDLLDCPGEAIVIGADRITLDLNGHTVSSVCETDCEGTAVIDNRGGYDRVRILNGTIRPLFGVAAGVVLVGADRNALEGLAVNKIRGALGQPGSVGVLLSNSHRNVLDSSTISGGDPAVLLSASDRNQILRSYIPGGITVRTGDGLRLLDGSDRNQVIDSNVPADAVGIGIFDSVGNRLARNRISGFFGAIVLRGARRTVISRNGPLTAGLPPFVAIEVFGSDNVIRRNEARSPLRIQGDRNRIQHNDVPIDVLGGRGNLVRNNSAMGTTGDGIAVQSAATNTLVAGNLATQNLDDGIDVDAPGTVIRGNTATDNGDLGIEAVTGVIDRGGNRASGNGNPLQCLNVACR
jgi:parallel beta-helix repeat protein